MVGPLCDANLCFGIGSDSTFIKKLAMKHFWYCIMKTSRNNLVKKEEEEDEERDCDDDEDGKCNWK